MRKLLKFVFILFLGVFCSACVNTFSVHKLNEIAVEHIDNGDLGGGIARLLSSVDLDGEVYETRYNLATAYIRNNECEKALEHLLKCVELNEKEPAVYHTLGTAQTCSAKQIFERKNEKGEIEEITYDIPSVAKKMDEKYNQYLEESIKNFETYMKMAPNASDIQDVFNQINKTKADIEKFNNVE